MKSVVIVDRDKTTAFVIQKYIKDLRYSISATLNSGDEAVKTIEQLHPDCVLMSMFPGGKHEGFELAQHINDKIRIPIIFMLCDSDKDSREYLKNMRGIRYLRKPIDKKELKSTLEMTFLRHKMDKRLKASEHRFATILNSIADAVIVTDSNGYVTYMNPVAESIMNCGSKKKIGKKLHEIIKIENHSIASLKKGIHFNFEDYKDYSFLIGAGGEKIPIDFSVSPQKDEDGRFIGTILVIRDISDRVKTECDLQKSFNQLRKAMGGIIQAMALTFETRDPYTAGHQRRVADLARQIASDMDLPMNTIESIRMAGIIHDLGKISTPAEILSKPGKVTDLEMKLIQLHPKNAYEILQAIDFPWPIADIIYQHHERMDGSGYPCGISSDEILIEARILAVADVVEAMTFHRPYRPALGISLALEEITKNKHTLYDTAVVDTCINLFSKKGYTMEFGH